jgi:hypothetical protein
MDLARAALIVVETVSRMIPDPPRRAAGESIPADVVRVYQYSIPRMRIGSPSTTSLIFSWVPRKNRVLDILKETDDQTGSRMGVFAPISKDPIFLISIS